VQRQAATGYEVRMSTHKRPVILGQRLRVGDVEWGVEYPVADARIVANRVIVLFDADAYWQVVGKPHFGQFPNLVAFDLRGWRLWTAQLPTNESGDCYDHLESEDPLRAYSWKSISCELDPATGAILHQTFTK
jgi:hypothetical protein